MSSITQVGRHDAGAQVPFSNGATPHEGPLGYFTSWRSAVASMVILAVVVAVVVVDLVAPLIG
jgi:hypothetical protein